MCMPAISFISDGMMVKGWADHMRTEMTDEDPPQFIAGES